MADHRTIRRAGLGKKPGIDWTKLAQCEVCHRPVPICVCDRLQHLTTRLKVLVLQHPQEQARELSSTPLLLQSLSGARCAIGLSWPSLSAALGARAEPGGWAVLFPMDMAKSPIRVNKANPCVVLDRQGNVVDPRDLVGVVVLDGTWSQAKTLWWRNPWIVKLPRMSLWLAEPSIYGALRPEPRPQFVSTLESVAAALDACGEAKETGAQLRRLFRTMVQRARDFQAQPMK